MSGSRSFKRSPRCRRAWKKGECAVAFTAVMTDPAGVCGEEELDVGEDIVMGLLSIRGQERAQRLVEIKQPEAVCTKRKDMAIKQAGR